LSSEPAGAVVELLGKRVGITPMLLPAVLPGQEVNLLLAGYLPSRFCFEPGESEARHFRLRPAPGTLIVNSVPAGADVICGGRILGSTPLVLPDQPQGQHQVVLRKTGFDEASYSVVLSPDEARGAVEHVFAPSTGSLRIVTRPARCTVIVDGVVLGETGVERGNPAVSIPFEVGRLLPGQHEVVVRPVGGGFAARRTVTLKPREDQEIEMQAWIVDTVVQLKSGGRRIYGMLLEKRPGGGLVLAEAPGKSQSFGAAEVLLVDKASLADKYGFSRGIEVKTDRFQPLVVTIWDPAGSDYRADLAGAERLPPMQIFQLEEEFRTSLFSAVKLKYRGKSMELSGRIQAVRRGGEFLSVDLGGRSEVYFRFSEEIARRLLGSLGKEVSVRGYSLGYRGLDRLVLTEAVLQ
jgi:hypothetical protein